MCELLQSFLSEQYKRDVAHKLLTPLLFHVLYVLLKTNYAHALTVLRVYKTTTVGIK